MIGAVAGSPLKLGPRCGAGHWPDALPPGTLAGLRRSGPVPAAQEWVTEDRLLRRGIGGPPSHPKGSLDAVHGGCLWGSRPLGAPLDWFPSPEA
ncbi:hypothetical protein NDU88_002105 [Pleurodeles waltl]|uniref:Uncharacterized protein n=1 Tax=Pleurodeles waltl TaxID=8319 RepID=A0AAV7KXZ1_PLEWA|nr:hypothetical protein NDU88_002105 [Pleurodeles waltl]